MKTILHFLITCGLLVLSACAVVQVGALASNRQAVSPGSPAENKPNELKNFPAKTLQFLEFYSPL